MILTKLFRDQVSLKAQSWYIPEIYNSRIPEMYCKRCPFLGGTRIVHFWYTRNGHSLLRSYIMPAFSANLCGKKTCSARGCNFVSDVNDTSTCIS